MGQSYRNIARKGVAAMIVGSVALAYRAAQELDWAPKDVVWFPLLVLATWILILLWGLSSHPLLLLHEKYLHGKRGLMIAILLGAAIGAISGAAWWKLALLHQQRMSELESVHAQIAEPKKDELKRLRDEAVALAAEFRSLQQRMDRDYELIHDRHEKRFFKATTEKERSQIFQEEMNEAKSSSDHFNEEYRQLRPRAIVVRDALLKYVPDREKDEEDKFAGHTLRNWFMAGVRPAANVGDYLEKLALSLPEK